MIATTQQLAKLERFAADQHGLSWQVNEEDGRPCASAVAEVTAEYVWYLQLEPPPAPDSPYAIDVRHTIWKARCFKENGSDELTFSGPLGDCTKWLEDRLTEWRREHDVAASLLEFAAGRPHWNFYDQGKGRYYAGRRFKYAGFGNHLLLSVGPHAPNRRRDKYRAQVNMMFSAGPEHVEIADTIGQITAWVNGWEQTMQVPLTLAECRREGAAREVVEKLSRTQLGNLAYLLDISGGPEIICHRLVEKFGPRSAG